MDGDGFAFGLACRADCDDNDPRRHPGAPEMCNGRDDDCDGLVDEPNEPGGPSPCACIPACDNRRQCGDDGCGGSCGTCPPNHLCLADGRCKCVADCTGRQCGDDGCGGSCGTCDGGVCNAFGRCNCVGSCVGKTCGDDGCGGSCGVCLTGACQGGRCTGCASDCVGRTCGDDGCGGSCGSCAGGRCNLGGRCSFEGTTNAAAWRPAPFQGPRMMHSQMQADYETQNKVVVFGGRSDSTSLGDTWVLDYAAASPVFQRLAPSPSPVDRAEAAFGFVAPSGPVVMAGGWNNLNGVLASTWTFNGAAWTQLASNYDWRYGTGVAGGIARPFVFGGFDQDLFGSYYLDDGASFTGSEWVWTAPGAPGKRYAPSMATWRSRNTALLFGGSPSPGVRLGDTWTYEFATGRFAQLNPSRAPPARYRAVLAEDRYNDVLVLFGGVATGSTPLGDTWIWDGRTWTEVTGTGPAPRARAGLSAARLKATNGQVTSCLLLVGGHGTSYAGYADAWIYGP